jgi:hypothetical protein
MDVACPRPVEYLAARDYPVLMGFTLFLAVLTIVGNLLADVLYAWAGQRVDMDVACPRPVEYLFGNDRPGEQPRQLKAQQRTRLSGADGVYSVSGGADDSR